ncbi:Phospholipase D delta [Linum perenne]
MMSCVAPASLDDSMVHEIRDVYLHGDLHLKIVEARQLPNMDLMSERVRRCFSVLDTCRKPFSGRRKNGRVAAVPVSRIAGGQCVREWFPIISSYGKPPKPDCAMLIEMKFVKCEENPLYKIGLDANPNRHGKCWEEISEAILEAHHLVYVVGWSVFHKVKLVREPSKPLPNGGNLILGDLLKYKSQEGVRVLMLVWDDKTSHNKFFIKTEGVMQTHDEETRKFFKHSSVNCVLSPRYASSVMLQVVGTLFTHHQKCVIVDTQASGNNRKITAFLGGLDLCDGRYDTPEHRLYRDVDTVFDGDFHNPTLPVGAKGPREPWHDLHCKIEGPAAYDVLTNFEQRWKKAAKWSEFGRKFKTVSHWHDDSLLKLERISWILSPKPSVSIDDPSLWVTEEKDPEKWHVQVFRSIDSGSLKGFPKDVFQAEAQNLVCAKNLVIDLSIQTAYIQAIRSAQHFVYIENQYFIGSSYAWPAYKEAGADNLIPMELALKICSKIRAKEKFAVYIVIPMWPEGLPSSTTVQAILFWQGQTMQTMYRLIAEELKSMKMEDAHPQDYLNFFCLGNREKLPKEKMPSSSSKVSNAPEVISSCHKHQRFMIYVHAKGMIVDDEYVIIGSANINQRSMSGSRDTEIAMGGYQPNHTWGNKKRHPRGQVYGYRMSLWAEHLGKLDDLYKEPESVECLKEVNKVAEENWEKFTSENFKPLQGHLLKYPVQVDRDGKVNPLPGHETFPDVGGKVLGVRTTLPDALTT